MNTKAGWNRTAVGHSSQIRARWQTAQTHRGTAWCCGSVHHHHPAKQCCENALLSPCTPLPTA